MMDLCKRLLAIMLLLVFIIGNSAEICAAPYDSYNYNSKKEAVPTPHSYLPSKIITGEDIGAGSFNNPEDIFIGADKRIYIVDTGNNRIICIDENWKFIREVSAFKREVDGQIIDDKFNSPYGVFVDEAGTMYVADTNNKRVIELDNEGNFIREIGAPGSEVIRADFNYLPRKLVIDKAQRMYVVGPGMFEGIVEFDAEGNFAQFTGSNKVKPNLLDFFWTRVVATEEQKAQTANFIPEEFNNLDIDSQGFLYTSSTKSFLKRLNNQGEDITKKIDGREPKGDYVFLHPYIIGGGETKFVDVCSDNYGIYTGLDSVRGRIFTYDSEGNLLSVFGRLGDQFGTFKNPVAIEALKEQLVVLDREYNRITVFDLTEYGRLVRQAVILHYNGEYSMASVMWEKVLKLNSNSELAYVGIGKSVLGQKRYKEAMNYFRLGNNKELYSKAYKKYRREAIREYFGTVMTVLILMTVLIVIIRRLRYKRASSVRGRYNVYADK